MRAFLFIPMLCGLLVGLNSCPEKPVQVAYKLSSVLPSPVTPGDAVTAFGVLPKDAVITLDGQVIAGARVSNGLKMALSANTVAGEHQLEIKGDGAVLTGSVVVNPRLDALAIDGSVLRVTGAGWTADSTLKLVVNGFELDVKADGLSLTSKLPETLAYGPVNVMARVGARSSNTVSVLRQAGAVQGKLTWPGSSSSLSIQQSGLQAMVSVRPQLAFIVHYATNFNADTLLGGLEGVVEHDAIPSLRVLRVTFADSLSAQRAFAHLNERSQRGSVPGVTGLEWDETVRAKDAFDVIAASIPAKSQTTSDNTALKANAVPGAGQWFLGLEGIPEAWQRSRGEGVVVAVLDTGTNLEHPDLKANILPGYDFIDDDAEPMDIAGHGTHVSGLVAANGQALGVSPGAKLLPVRVLRDTTSGSAFAVAQGILYAAGLLPEHNNPNPAQVINLSLGSDTYSSTIANAITQAQTQGVIVVAAAGNSGGPISYPAALPGVIAVTALAGPAGSGLTYQPSYASRGTGVWVTAFGGDMGNDQDRNGVPDGILSTDLTAGGYGLRMGTSMASPQVAGLVALALSSGTPANLMRQTLGATATDLGPRGYDLNYGHGLISGRIGTPSTPRIYVIARTLNALQPLSIALVQPDGSYLLGNLPAKQPLELLAASDADGDGIVAEAGELLSNTIALSVRSGEILPLNDVALSLSDGRQSTSIKIP